MKPRLLDLFCKAGGATHGYQMAGFHVTGVDKDPQPRYVGDAFIQADALEYVAAHGHEFDAIHASPPCQAYTRTNAAYRKFHPDLIEPTRRAIQMTGKPYVIENVEDARRLLVNPIKLCGSMLGLNLWRHRYFEIGNCGIWFLVPPCRHDFAPVLLTGTPRRSGQRRIESPLSERKLAAEIDWMTMLELDEAIPPAYTQFVGEQLMNLFR